MLKFTFNALVVDLVPSKLEILGNTNHILIINLNHLCTYFDDLLMLYHGAKNASSQCDFKNNVFPFPL